tara:strand:+ start:3455 stop:4213 length:759 start_codon:yes stop_codon:yes gene_type:complete
VGTYSRNTTYRKSESYPNEKETNQANQHGIADRRHRHTLPALRHNHRSHLDLIARRQDRRHEKKQSKIEGFKGQRKKGRTPNQGEDMSEIHITSADTASYYAKHYGQKHQNITDAADKLSDSPNKEAALLCAILNRLDRANERNTEQDDLAFTLTVCKVIEKYRNSVFNHYERWKKQEEKLHGFMPLDVQEWMGDRLLQNLGSRLVYHPQYLLDSLRNNYWCPKPSSTDSCYREYRNWQKRKATHKKTKVKK